MQADKTTRPQTGWTHPQKYPLVIQHTLSSFTFTHENYKIVIFPIANCKNYQSTAVGFAFSASSFAAWTVSFSTFFLACQVCSKMASMENSHWISPGFPHFCHRKMVAGHRLLSRLLRMQLRNLCVLAKPGTNRGFLVACDNSLTSHDKEKNYREET